MYDKFFYYSINCIIKIKEKNKNIWIYEIKETWLMNLKGLLIQDSQKFLKLKEKYKQTDKNIYNTLSKIILIENKFIFIQSFNLFKS